MKKTIKHLLLALPLLWFINVWLVFVFDIRFDFGVFYDSNPHPEDPPSKGIFPDWILLIMLFFGTPITFILGSIYTFFKKHWWWFSAYIVLGGGPVGIYFGAILWAKYVLN